MERSLVGREVRSVRMASAVGPSLAICASIVVVSISLVRRIPSSVRGVRAFLEFWG